MELRALCLLGWSSTTGNQNQLLVLNSCVCVHTCLCTGACVWVQVRVCVLVHVCVCVLSSACVEARGQSQLFLRSCPPFFPSSRVPACVCVCMYVYAFICVCLYYVYIRPEANVKNHPWLFFRLNHWDRISRLNPELAYTTCLADQLPGIERQVTLMPTGLNGLNTNLCRFWKFELRFSLLCGKH